MEPFIVKQFGHLKAISRFKIKFPKIPTTKILQYLDWYIMWRKISEAIFTNLLREYKAITHPLRFKTS